MRHSIDMFILHAQAKSKQDSHAAVRVGPGWPRGEQSEKRVYSLYIHVSKSMSITDGCGWGRRPLVRLGRTAGRVGAVGKAGSKISDIGAEERHE